MTIIFLCILVGILLIMNIILAIFVVRLENDFTRFKKIEYKNLLNVINKNRIKTKKLKKIIKKIIKREK